MLHLWTDQGSSSVFSTIKYLSAGLSCWAKMAGPPHAHEHGPWCVGGTAHTSPSGWAKGKTELWVTSHLFCVTESLTKGEKTNSLSGNALSVPGQNSISCLQTDILGLRLLSGWPCVLWRTCHGKRTSGSIPSLKCQVENDSVIWSICLGQPPPSHTSAWFNLRSPVPSGTKGTGCGCGQELNVVRLVLQSSQELTNNEPQSPKLLITEGQRPR